MAARRLLALYSAVQAKGEVFGPGGELGAEVQGALAAVLSQRLEVGEDGAGRAAEAARILHEFMAEDLLLSPGDADEHWSAFVSKVALYVHISGLEQRPCTSRLKMRPGGGHPVATLESVFDVSNVDFERAITFLDPGEWPKCMDFWCEMGPVPDLPNDVHRYNEMVSTDCHDPDHAVFTARAVLDFDFKKLPDAAFASYGLAPGHPQTGDDLTVDEGSLTVARMQGFLHIRTTKRVEFSRVFRGDQLAAIGCALGWTDMGKAMMYNCACLPEDDFQRAARRDPLRVPRGDQFRGPTPTVSRPSAANKSSSGTSRRSAPRSATPGSRRSATSGGAVMPDIVRQTAKAIKDCVDDQAAFMEQWADRAADEDYGYQEMLDDMARASVRMVLDSARILNLAVKNAEVGAAAARAPRADQPAAAGGLDEEEERP
jgi:hypothetical protein